MSIVSAANERAFLACRLFAQESLCLIATIIRWCIGSVANVYEVGWYRQDDLLSLRIGPCMYNPTYSLGDVSKVPFMTEWAAVHLRLFAVLRSEGSLTCIPGSLLISVGYFTGARIFSEVSFTRHFHTLPNIRSKSQ